MGHKSGDDTIEELEDGVTCFGCYAPFLSKPVLLDPTLSPWLGFTKSYFYTFARGQHNFRFEHRLVAIILDGLKCLEESDQDVRHLSHRYWFT